MDGFDVRVLLYRGELLDPQVSCCYLEIYNEDIRDLLQPGGPSLHQQKLFATGIFPALIEMMCAHGKTMNKSST